MRQRDIFWFWFPLFASWLLMSAEGPIVSAAINRLPNEVLMLAAQGIVVSLEVTIESPIINLLATATALTQDRRSYLLLRRFTLHWLIALTLVATLFAYTGVFDVVVTNWMRVPNEVATWVRPGMQIMILWTAAIGWRRFMQGILIRFNRTRTIAWGTLVRLAASGGGAIVLAWWSGWPGVVIGAVALMVGVIAEAIYATIVVQPVLQNELGPNSPPAAGAPLTYRDLFWFHLPLAGTAFLILLVQPMVAFSLARLDNPTVALAAWSLVFQFSLLARAGAHALPEAVIALTKGPETRKPVRKFTWTIAVVFTVLMALFVFTPLNGLYLFELQDTTAEVGNMARQGMVYFLLLPALTVLISWLRGLFINARRTRIVTLGMVLNLLVTGVILFVGMQLKLSGLLTAALALNGAAAVELAVLWWQAQRGLAAIQNRPMLADGASG